MEEANETLLNFMIEQSFNVSEDTEISWNISRKGVLWGTFDFDGERHMVKFYPESNTFCDGGGDVFYDEEVAKAVDKMIHGIIIEMAKEAVEAMGIQVCDESLAAEKED